MLHIQELQGQILEHLQLGLVLNKEEDLQDQVCHKEEAIQEQVLLKEEDFQEQVLLMEEDIQDQVHHQELTF